MVEPSSPSGWEGIENGELREMATAALKNMNEAQSYARQPLHIRSRAEQWELGRNEILLGDKIGEGDGGVIYCAVWRGIKVVAKMLKSDCDRPSNIDGKVAREDLIHEMSVLSRLRHPNLVMFLGACTVEEPLIILSEYMRGGNLEDFLMSKTQENKGQVWVPPAKLVQRWVVELARALCFLHNCSPIIIHRDLKPANLLMNESGHLKIGDFGLCKVKDIAKISGTYCMTGNTGSFRYMAPEVFANSPTYDEKVDIYSTAMIMWYIAMGERPFDRVEPQIVAQQACNARLRPSLDALYNSPNAGPVFCSLVSKSWDGDPANRPSANELVDALDAWGATFSATKKKESKNCIVS